MLRVTTQVLHSELLTEVPQGCLPVRFILAESQVHSITEVYDSRMRTTLETFHLQYRSRWCLSRYAEKSSLLLIINIPGSLHGVLELCLAILSEWYHWVLVIRCSLGFSGDPDQAVFTFIKGIFTMLVKFCHVVLEVCIVPMRTTYKNY